MKWIYSIIVVVIMITICILFFIKNDNNCKYSKELNKLINTKLKYDKLENIYYDKSGDKIGSLEEISIDIDKKTLQYRHTKAHDIPVEVEIYKINNNDIKELEKMIKEYNLPAWSELKMSDIMIYDAATETITFNYNNAKIGGQKTEWYSINFNMEIPADGYSLIIEFRDKLYSFIVEKNLIKSYVEEKDRLNE